MSRTRILIVEDENIVARDIQNMLERSGYTVSFIASEGKDAIEKSVKTKPDLILMDIKLKNAMDGIETAEQIRKRLSVPIVYMSALSDKESLSRAKKTEPFFFIPKPIDRAKLQETIEKACSAHKSSLNSRKSK